MAAAAMGVISTPAGSLLRTQSKFGIGFAPLNFTAYEHDRESSPNQIAPTPSEG